MSFIQETYQCKSCKKYFNVALGTYGYGMPTKCGYCGSWPNFDHIGSGWKAEELNKKKQTEELVTESKEDVNKLKSSHCEDALPMKTGYAGEFKGIIIDESPLFKRNTECECHCEECFEGKHCANTKCGSGPIDRRKHKEGCHHKDSSVHNNSKARCRCICTCFIPTFKSEMVYGKPKLFTGNEAFQFTGDHKDWKTEDKDTVNVTIKYYAIHRPKEHPDFGFPTKEEARAFIKGYALGCGHEGKRELCKGALAEWDIKEVQ